MNRETLYDKVRVKRRNQIIKASKKYFLKNGLSSNINMKDIALCSKISRQTLYKYHKNIDEVILAVHEDVVTDAIEYVKTLYVKKEHYIDSVKLAIKLLFTYGKDKQDDALFLTLFYAYARNKSYKDVIHKDYSRMINEIPDMFGNFERYKDDSSLRHDLDPTIARLVVVNCIAGTIQAILLSEKSDVELDYDKVISEVTTMIERYLTPLN